MSLESIEYLLSLGDPYLLAGEDKQKILANELSRLDAIHRNSCKPYSSIIEASEASIINLPVRLFKLLNLKSVTDENTFKVLTSSGTTSQVVSKIYLDKETAQLQTKVLVHIMQSFLGKQRLPMLIIDHPGVIKNRATFSARGAGILGLSNFGRNHTYALDENMNIDFEHIEAFLLKHDGQPIFIFGFTFMVWQYFVQKLKLSGKVLDLSKAILVHSGGWKKLQDQAVDNIEFKRTLLETCSISKVHNFYGMVEQVGSIFVECEHGYLHSPNFADISFIDLDTMQSVGQGSEGVVVVESIIPRSYPGHRLLTEDKGYLVGEDDCNCGRKGKYFTITGRLPKAEVRGCSDTHEKK
ncbi:LuxE/PaaK family acyltransferase [Pseudoalteromonas peptidolytica]|uniref:LuxE/PaaK family acyltransferase n=1 Tax=Pseudoalteromonas peptidolytica TaxID=61150 RepID=UPI00298D993C|nr:acyl-protein synthetase [Pseudoalteromonas peptidolytica]MDW7549442.1 acyl-protein synthetase [Pseudoalteromonas peptidolytica]